MMNKIHKIIENPAFLEASREELRVLLALLAGCSEDADKIAAICNISRARASSALSFWHELDSTDAEAAPTITTEFEERLRRGEIEEESSLKVAADIRDLALADLITECAKLMNKAALSTNEIKKIAALRTQYALSEEYILTLAAYLAEKGKLTTTRLVNDALKLVEKNIDTCEALEADIKIRESESGIERELKNVLGINGRPLSTREKEYLRKWSKDYGYFTEILKLAYDICIDNTSKLSMSYVDKLLTSWYTLGCRTRSECFKEAEEFRLKEAEKRKKRAAAKKAGITQDKPRYGDFDVKDAFKRALERSYGKEEQK